jgi:polyisoprenoid-binding protein YceI
MDIQLDSEALMADTTSTTRRVDVPAAGSYRLDPARSTIAFRTKHLFGLAGVQGSLKIASGTIDVDPSVPRATVSVIVDATSFESGHAKRDGDVHKAKFLDTARHPQFGFQATRLTQDSSGTWSLSGTLTVRGITQPVTLAVTSVEIVGRGFRASATSRIDRYAFGLTAAKGMAARFLDLELTALAEPV